MKSEEVEHHVEDESHKRLVRHELVCVGLCAAFIIMLLTASSPKVETIIYTLSSGLVVSAFFTLMLVIIPEQRRKRKTVTALLHIPSFILEAEEGGFFTWSKNVIFCDPEKSSLESIRVYREKVEARSLNAAQIKITLEHSTEALHLFENSLPAAMGVSSTHGFYWMGMTSSMKKLYDVYYKHHKSFAENQQEMADEYYLYASEFAQSLECFVQLEEKPNALDRLVAKVQRVMDKSEKKM